MNHLGRYVVFAFNRHEIKGGWDDFLTDFDCPEKALRYVAARRTEFDHIDVIDTWTRETICPVQEARVALLRYREATQG